MTVLDRYIARQYLLNFAFLLGSLFTIILLIDFSLNFDEYADVAARTIAPPDGKDAAFGPVALRTLAIVWNLWWPRLFQLTGFMMGLVMVGAMGFTCVQLIKHREFIAVLAGGISLHRLARPIILVALLLSALQIVNREWIVPKLAPLLIRDKKQAGAHGMGIVNQPLCTDSQDRLFYAQRVDLDHEAIEGLFVWERDQAGLMTRRITADSAHYKNGKWILTNGLAQSRRMENTQTQMPAPVPIAELETDLDPTALKLRRFEGFSHNLSSSQLSQLIDRYQTLPDPPLRRVEEMQRILFGRIALLLTNLLALILCLPFFLKREPCNMVVQSLYAAPVALIAIAAGFLGATSAIPGLPPQVSVFVPVLVLFPLAIAAVTHIKT